MRPWLVVLELALGVLVPNVICSILAVSGECTELLIENNSVHSVNLGWFWYSSCVIDTMRFEAKIVSLVD